MRNVRPLAILEFVAREARCQIYAQEHLSTDHECSICQAKKESADILDLDVSIVIMLIKLSQKSVANGSGFSLDQDHFIRTISHLISHLINRMMILTVSLMYARHPIL